MTFKQLWLLNFKDKPRNFATSKKAFIIIIIIIIIIIPFIYIMHLVS